MMKQPFTKYKKLQNATALHAETECKNNTTIHFDATLQNDKTLTTDNFQLSFIILAAGKSKRFNSKKTKILHKIGGLTLIDHVIYTCSNFKNSKIYTVVSNDFNPLDIKFSDKSQFCIQHNTCGTGDAVNVAYNFMIKKNDTKIINKIQEFVFILYADMPLISENTLKKTLKNITDKNYDGAIISLDVSNNPNDFGLLAINPINDCQSNNYAHNIQHFLHSQSNECLNNHSNLAHKKNEQKTLSINENINFKKSCDKSEINDEFLKNLTIAKIIEKKDLSGNDRVIQYANCGLVLKMEILDKFLPKLTQSTITNELYITQIIELANDYGYKIGITVGNKDELIGVNTKNDFINANNIFQKQKRTEAIANGVILLAPESVYFSYDTKIECDVIVEPFVVFLEGVSISAGVIKSFTTIGGAQIQDAEIGPFARVRPNSVIKKNVRIGNFVEVKNSTIDSGSKINHLSYVGDVDVGCNCNIGAGSIFCNYDGFFKYRSVVKNNVFIGSNSTVISPILIKEHSIIAAGTVVNKDIEANDFAIARTAQQNYKNGAEKFRVKKSKKV